MTLEDATLDMIKTADGADPVGATFKFVFEDGVIHVDGTGDPAVVTNEDKEVDCALHMKIATYAKLKSGKLSPTMALMTGKVKVKGDMSIALKLQNYL